jgi:hypothetical protein
MKGQLSITAATVIALLFAAVAIGANEKLTLQVTPSVSRAPTALIVRAYVEPDVANRRLRIEADSDVFYRSSEIQLDGDKAPMLTEFRFKSVPGGEYIVRATLFDAMGEQTVVWRTALVLSGLREP